MLLVRGGKSGYQMSNVKVSVAQMERGVSRGKREVCPSDQATRRAWGNWLTLACRGRGRSPSKRRQATIAKLVWRSRCQTWQDKPRRGGVRWIQKNPSYISCMEHS